MKKQKLTLIAFLIIGVICTSCTNNRNNIREIPKQAKKRIITTYYQPILNNGIWICGGEMEESPERSTVYPDTAYYDEYNNLLLSIDKGASIIKKNVYYSPSKQQLQSKCILYTKTNIFKEVEFIRDNNGILLEMKGDENKILVYDSNGQMSKMLNDKKELIESYSKLPSPDDIETEVTRTYNSDGEVIEQNTYIKSKKTKLLQREIIEFEASGENIKDDLIYSYDSLNRVIIKEWERTTTSNSGMIRRFEYGYNTQGDIVYSVCLSQNKNGLYVLKPLSHRYAYEYNKNNDWIKKITFYTADDNGDFKPSFITIREIEYYNKNKL